MFNMYAIKKDVYTKTVKYFIDLKCYEDIANVPKLIYFSKKIVNIPYIGYNYYRDDNSITKKEDNDIKVNKFKKACNDIIYFFKKQLTENDELYLQIKDYYL